MFTFSRRRCFGRNAFTRLLMVEKGAVLVEILVAMVLFSLAAVSFVAMFTGSYAGVKIAGNKSDALYTVYTDVETLIDGYVPGSNAAPDTLTINFSGTAVQVAGKHISETEESSDGRLVRLEVFVPDRLAEDE